MKIGDKIRELRISNNLTQQQISDAIGFSHSAISQYENNIIEPTATAIMKLATVFGVSSDYLLGLEDDMGYSKSSDIQNAVTPEERKIIAAYRELTPSNKNMVLRMLNIESK